MNLMGTEMLTPALALITWTCILWFWMYSTRIPAIQSAGIDPDSARHPGSLNVLPAKVRQIADNYNHLHEQPTVFYALVFYTQLAGNGNDINVYLAWGYVALRVIHSLIQCTVNVVPMRFSVFALSTLVMVALVIRNLIQLF